METVLLNFHFFQKKSKSKIIFANPCYYKISYLLKIKK